MIFGTAALGPAALDGAAIRRSLETLGLEQVLCVVSESATARDLAGLRAQVVRGPTDQLDAMLAVARTTRAGRLVLELPADLELEAACRGLYDISRRLPALELALLTPRSGSLAHPEPLGLVLEDLAGQRLGYWHRPSAAALAGQGDTVWLDALDRHLVGMSLDDVVGDEAGLPPGTGEIDFDALASWTVRKLDLALDVEAVPDVGLLALAVAALAASGLS